MFIFTFAFMIMKWKCSYFYKCAIIWNGYVHHLIKPRDLLNVLCSESKRTIKEMKKIYENILEYLIKLINL